MTSETDDPNESWNKVLKNGIPQTKLRIVGKDEPLSFEKLPEEKLPEKESRRKFLTRAAASVLSLSGLAAVAGTGYKIYQNGKEAGERKINESIAIIPCELKAALHSNNETVIKIINNYDSIDSSKISSSLDFDRSLSAINSDPEIVSALLAEAMSSGRANFIVKLFANCPNASNIRFYTGETIPPLNQLMTVEEVLKQSLQEGTVRNIIGEWWDEDRIANVMSNIDRVKNGQSRS